MEEESDSEEEQGAGATIKGVLQHMVQGMNSQEGDRSVNHATALRPTCQLQRSLNMCKAVQYVDDVTAVLAKAAVFCTV